MDAIVRFRFNKKTGQVEELRIDAVGSHLGEEEHNQRHEAIAASIGHLLDRLPQIEEVIPDAAAAPSEPLRLAPEAEGERAPEGPSRHTSEG